MTDLATQIEQAKPAEQWAMLVAAWEHIYGAPAVQSERGLVYHRLLGVNTDEAFIGAALMMVPTELYEGLRLGSWWWMVEVWQGETTAHIAYENGDAGIPEFGSKAATPALAIAAACVRAHDKEDRT